MSSRIRLGISACLLGQAVRYDGGHTRDPFLVDTLGPYVEWVPVCPEFELGLGVPRPTLRLEGDPAAPRMVRPSTGADITAAMQGWCEQRSLALRAAGLRGFVLKARSPSCGLLGVKVFDADAVPHLEGVGLWARCLAERYPTLPIEEEGRLLDMGVRERFLERVFGRRVLGDVASALLSP